MYACFSLLLHRVLTLLTLVFVFVQADNKASRAELSAAKASLELEKEQVCVTEHLRTAVIASNGMFSLR